MKNQENSGRNGQGKNALIPANRDSAGRFVPGLSGNPTGRPKTKLLTDAYKARLEADGADVYADVVCDIALNPKNRASDRLQAVQEMTDRVEGKAVQAHKIEAGIDAGTARALIELAGKMQPQIAVIVAETGMNPDDLHVNCTLPENAPVITVESIGE